MALDRFFSPSRRILMTFMGIRGSRKYYCLIIRNCSESSTYEGPRIERFHGLWQKLFPSFNRLNGNQWKALSCHDTALSKNTQNRETSQRMLLTTSFVSRYLTSGNTHRFWTASQLSVFSPAVLRLPTLKSATYQFSSLRASSNRSNFDDCVCVCVCV